MAVFCAESVFLYEFVQRRKTKRRKRDKIYKNMPKRIQPVINTVGTQKLQL